MAEPPTALRPRGLPCPGTSRSRGRSAPGASEKWDWMRGTQRNSAAGFWEQSGGRAPEVPRDPNAEPGTARPPSRPPRPPHPSSEPRDMRRTVRQFYRGRGRGWTRFLRMRGKWLRGRRKRWGQGCRAPVLGPHNVSSPRKRGPIHPLAQGVRWVPAFAGMTPGGWGPRWCSRVLPCGAFAGMTRGGWDDDAGNRRWRRPMV
jgi:hypothetical protein